MNHKQAKKINTVFIARQDKEKNESNKKSRNKRSKKQIVKRAEKI